jgi:dTDP-4-amino-4,6-dideoxygalactose transaminase
MPALAIRGGKKTFSGVWPAWPVFAEEDEEALRAVLRSRNWGGYPSPNARACQFAEAFARAHDAAYGICCSNGTVSLELALRAAGIKAGDEVIVPPYTWIATAGAPVMVNAVPVFVDIDPETYCLDPTLIEAAITDRTRAVIPVHLGCSVANLDAIMEIGRQRGLTVIEDCAHAHGARWRGRGVGSIGHLGSFSFQSSKLMTSGEGGILLTSDKNLEERCQSLVNCGRKEPGCDGYEGWVFSGNYRITEFQAALLSVRLRHLEGERAHRERNVATLCGLLEGQSGIRPLHRPEALTHLACYQLILRYDAEAFEGLPRDAFVEALSAEGIPAEGDFYLPVYQSPLFAVTADRFPAIRQRYGERIASDSVRCPVAERAAFREAVWLHHSLFLAGSQEMEAIAAAIRKIEDNVHELL